MRILVIGLRGTGKSFFCKQHKNDDTLFFDLDRIAEAFRLAGPDEERHKPARLMANDLLKGFVEHGERYVETIAIIRMAPDISEIKMICPDLLVICNKQYEQKEMDDEEKALRKINAARKYAHACGITVRELN